MSVAEYEIDYSDVAGRRIECPPQCGLCCLCQPEVLPEERAYFRSRHPECLIKTRGADPHFALALKKGKGSCVFLEDRRCRIYDHRTAYCRQFPFHFYVSDRVKVELDLSCRGAWYGTGADAEAEARSLAAAADRRLSSAVREASAVYREFYANCREAGVMSDPVLLRTSVSGNISSFTDLGYISRVMELSLEEPRMSLEGVRPEGAPDMEELEDAARSAAMESLGYEDPVSVPVYCDRDWNWNLFMAREDSIEWAVLDDDGEIHHRAFADPAKIGLRPPEPEGARVLAEYLSVLNGRDSMMGSVFALMDETGYEDDMANAYYGALSATVLDVLWRASMLDHFMSTGMGAEGMKETIIFYDMDRLDAPTIGAFV